MLLLEKSCLKLHLASAAAAAAKSLQSCLTLCDPTDGSPPGSAVPGILQARTLEWAAISYLVSSTPQFLSLTALRAIWSPSATPASFLRAKSLQSCPSLWDPADCSPPGSSPRRGCHAHLQDLPRDRPRLRHWQAGSWPLAPPARPAAFAGSWNPSSFPSAVRCALSLARGELELRMSVYTTLRISFKAM